MTISAMESGSVQDAPLKATANCARGTSPSIILTWFVPHQEHLTYQRNQFFGIKNTIKY